jgi:hypothetical protein
MFKSTPEAHTLVFMTNMMKHHYPPPALLSTLIKEQHGASLSLTRHTQHPNYSRLPLSSELKLRWTATESLRLARTIHEYPSFTQPSFVARLPLHRFRLSVHMRISCFEPAESKRILHLFENTITHTHTHHTTTQSLKPIMNKYENAIYLKIDHNTRQYAITCPARHHDELKTAFIMDTKHFRVIKPHDVINGFTIGKNVEESVMAYTRSRLNNEWLPHTWKYKPAGISYVYIMVKDDGVRFRPIGSSSPLPHARLLSLVSMALNTILRNCNLKHATLWTTHTMKEQLAQLNQRAHEHNLFIHFEILDVKNFYTEINKIILRGRLRYIMDRYTSHNHTQYVSVPKYGKHPKPKPGKADDGQYYSFHIQMILDIVFMALDTAFFKLGIVILLQILGLVMGDPLSPPLAQCYVSFDEHFHSLLNHKQNTNIVHTFMERYMDDVIAILLTSTRDTKHADAFFDHLCKNTYEHDQTNKNLFLVRSKEGNKFLGYDIILNTTHTSIKVIYHNKNKDTLYTDTQDIGRFLHKTANAPYRDKINRITNTLTTAFTNTTFETDLGPSIHEILHEATTLSFNPTDLRSAVINAKKTRPSLIWDHWITGFTKHIDS